MSSLPGPLHVKVPNTVPPNDHPQTVPLFVRFHRSGEAGVGKSCLLLRYSDDQFSGSYISTIGCVQWCRSPRKEKHLLFWGLVGGGGLITAVLRMSMVFGSTPWARLECVVRCATCYLRRGDGADMVLDINARVATEKSRRGGLLFEWTVFWQFSSPIVWRSSVVPLVVLPKFCWSVAFCDRL